jgi:hypothetical protein
MESQLANKQIGINKVVKTTNNKLIPSTPNKKYNGVSVSLIKPLPPDQEKLVIY